MWEYEAQIKYKNLLPKFSQIVCVEAKIWNLNMAPKCSKFLSAERRKF